MEKEKQDAIDDAKKAERECSEPITALLMSQSSIERKLKPPSSADFPYVIDSNDGVKTKYMGDCTHKVWSYVDSENSFGAMIRTKYFVEIKYDIDAAAWILLHFQL